MAEWRRMSLRSTATVKINFKQIRVAKQLMRLKCPFCSIVWYRNFSMFNMAAVHRRRFLKIEIFNRHAVQVHILHHCAKFRGGQSILLTHTVQTNLMSDLIVCLVFHLFQFDLFRRLFCNFVVVRVPFQTFSTHGKTKLTLCRKCSYSPSSKWQSIHTSL